LLPKPYCGPPRSARPATSKEPSCCEIEVIIRDFESGLGVFADDGAFAFGSRRDIELGARILYDHCVRWGMPSVIPHTAGKTVAMYFGQPVVNLREFLPDEAIPPIKMGDGEAPVVPEFKHLGSMLSKKFDDSVTIMARIRLARIAFTKLQKAIFGTRRVALESKKIAHESLVLSLLLYGSECWVVSAENVRLLQRLHRKCIRIMTMQGHSPPHSEASHLDKGTGGEAGHPRHQALCSFEGAEILRARLSYGRRPDAISPVALLGSGWQAAYW
jgi:hypothetical protein